MIQMSAPGLVYMQMFDYNWDTFLKVKLELM